MEEHIHDLDEVDGAASSNVLDEALGKLHRLETSHEGLQGELGEFRDKFDQLALTVREDREYFEALLGNQEPAESDWFFSFGIEQHLAAGRIIVTEAHRGLCLHGRYIRIQGATSEHQARELATELLGANWCGPYDPQKIALLRDKFKWKELAFS